MNMSDTVGETLQNLAADNAVLVSSPAVLQTTAQMLHTVSPTQLKHSISASALNNTPLITIRAHASNEQLAITMANTVANTFIQIQTNNETNRLQQTMNHLALYIGNAKMTLDTAQQQLLSLQQEHAITQSVEQQQSIVDTDQSNYTQLLNSFSQLQVQKLQVTDLFSVIQTATAASVTILKPQVWKLTLLAAASSLLLLLLLSITRPGNTLCCRGAMLANNLSRRRQPSSMLSSADEALSPTSVSPQQNAELMITPLPQLNTHEERSTQELPINRYIAPDTLPRKPQAHLLIPPAHLPSLQLSSNPQSLIKRYQNQQTISSMQEPQAQHINEEDAAEPETPSPLPIITKKLEKYLRQKKMNTHPIAERKQFHPHPSPQRNENTVTPPEQYT
jgi:capsular polysaccharide biosynthesis protein